MLAPLIDGAADKSFMYIFGSLGIASAVCSLLLRETKGELMADTTEQEDSRFNNKKFNEEMRETLLGQIN